MNLELYEEISGVNVTTSRQSFVNAQIEKSQRILELQLGYTLDPDLYDDNFYTEIGKTGSDCPCPQDVNVDNLVAADEVVGAYRVFQFNENDRFWLIDPCTEIHAVKLVNKDVTYKTFEDNEYRVVQKHGFIKSLEVVDCDCLYTCCDCDQVELAVDAMWLWDNSLYTFPRDLLVLWSDLVTYNSDRSKNIKSQSLGSHSYTKFTDDNPLGMPYAKHILNKYAGGNGEFNRLPVR